MSETEWAPDWRLWCLSKTEAAAITLSAIGLPGLAVYTEEQPSQMAGKTANGLNYASPAIALLNKNQERHGQAMPGNRTAIDYLVLLYQPPWWKVRGTCCFNLTAAIQLKRSQRATETRRKGSSRWVLRSDWMAAGFVVIKCFLGNTGVYFSLSCFMHPNAHLWVAMFAPLYLSPTNQNKKTLEIPRTLILSPTYCESAIWLILIKPTGNTDTKLQLCHLEKVSFFLSFFSFLEIVFLRQDFSLSPWLS